MLLKGRRKMSLFRKKNAKAQDADRYKNMFNTPLLDLRHYSPAALKNIKMLNVATVILPEKPDEALMEAYGSIPIKNVADEIFTDKDVQFCSINGVAELDCAKCSEDTFYTVNGIVALLHSKEKAIKIKVNGTVVYEKGCPAELMACNGRTCAVDFEIKNVKILADKASVDKDFVENLADGTVVLCKNALTFELDITPALLKGRKLFFAAGQTIKCSRRTLGIMQTMSAASRYKTFL